MSTQSKSEASAAELQALDNGFMGHPAPLRSLFFTEMWERFSYYSIRPLLVLFMVATVSSGGFGFDEVTSRLLPRVFLSLNRRNRSETAPDRFSEIRR